MLTCRELSVCATKVNVYGIVCGSTVITLTAGAGRCDGGVSLEQPAASAAAQHGDGYGRKQRSSHGFNFYHPEAR